MIGEDGILPMTAKVPWEGRLTSVQPRIRLLRSFDQRHHSYLGYVLWVDGVVGGEEREFSIAVGSVAQAKHEFEVGDTVRGESAPVPDRRLEIAEYYKTSGLKVVDRPKGDWKPPPWLSPPQPLEVYRERGHRRLALRTYDANCTVCVWGCLMPVEMIIDQWDPGHVKYRQESFCYGPKSCSIHRAGPTRKVPGRHGMVWEEEDWVDKEATDHRGPDD